MALFKPYRVTNATQLDSVPIVEGQFLVVESTGEIYFDKNASTRINVAKDGYTVTISGDTLSLLDSSGTTVSTATIPSVVNAVEWNNADYPDINHFDCYNKDEIDTMLVNMTGADGTNAGVRGFVPAPAAADNTKFLKGDGSWTEVETLIKTANGTSISLTDSAYTVFSHKNSNGLEVKGNTVQVSEPTPTNPVDVISAGESGNINIAVCNKNLFQLQESETKNGVTFTNNGDGTFNLTGTNTSEITNFYVPSMAAYSLPPSSGAVVPMQ